MPTRTPQSLLINSGNVTWTNMPLASTELFGNVHRRVKKDFTDVDKIRLVARVSTDGVAAAVIQAQYSTDESAWLTLTANTLSLATPTGTKATAWGDLPAGAKGDVFVRIIGSGGDGAADPILGNICLEYI